MADDTVSNDDPMTEAQRIYIDTLSSQAGESTPPDNLTKNEAKRKIEQLRQTVTGSGVEPPDIDSDDDPNLDDET